MLDTSGNPWINVPSPGILDPSLPEGHAARIVQPRERVAAKARPQIFTNAGRSIRLNKMQFRAGVRREPVNDIRLDQNASPGDASARGHYG